MKIAVRSPGVPEIFHSIQGEGVSLGLPSVFVRASLCNLHCIWCDTDYTWNWEGTPFAHARDAQPGYAKYRKHEQLIEMSPQEIAAAVLRFPARNVVLTGGEPLLQQAGWEDLVQRLRRQDPAYRFEVETSGTLMPSVALAELVDQFNVSPKLASSAQPAELRLPPEPLRWFADSSKASFKFVVEDPERDLAEVLELVELYRVPAGRVLLMPQATTARELDERGPWIAEQCKQHGFRYGDRLHIRLWGSQRGV